MQTMNPTSGQLERSLWQQIQTLYREYLGHRPGKVTCQLFDEKLAIVIENSITQPEQLLAEDGQDELVKQLREGLDDAIQPQLKALIERILSVKVVDVLTDATLETGRTGMIVILSTTPLVRDPEVIRKIKAKSAA